MKIGFKWVLGILLLNLTCGLVYKVGVPGTQYSNILGGTGKATSYETRFNTTEFSQKLEPKASDTWTFVGNVWSGLQLLVNTIWFLIAGFPTFLSGIGYQIGNPAAQVAFNSLAVIFTCVTWFIGILWMYQLFTGRDVD